jgi:uncharacterized membrane protein YdjX (TVP38/TMEM64 family)
MVHAQSERRVFMKDDDGRLKILSFRSIYSLIFLITLGVLLIWVSFNMDLPAPKEMREIIVNYGWAGWLVFLGITAAIAITPIPVTVPALVAGSLYGLVGGSFLSFSGVMIGSWIGYWLARFAGRRLTFQLLGRHGTVVESYLNNAGFWAMCTARVMPALPYWPINYGAGALGVKQYTFISSTFLASIPGQVSLVALGAFAVEPSLLHGAVLVCAWLAVLIFTWVSYRYWRGTNNDMKDSEKAK